MGCARCCLCFVLATALSTIDAKGDQSCPSPGCGVRPEQQGMTGTGLLQTRPGKVTKAATSIDRLTITQIKCHKPAGGIDAAGIAGFAALGAVVAGGATAAVGGATVIGTGGAAIGTVPVTAVMVAKAAASGASTGAAAAAFLDGTFSGQDDLIVKVDGMQVLPSSGTFFPMKAGQKIEPNIQVSIQGRARISLIEYDTGSDNDDLGSLDVQGGSDRAQDEVIVLAPRDEDGSIYYVSYKIEAGKGDPLEIVGYVMCGTNQCDACQHENCAGQDYGELDRDKDKGDLKQCPSGMSTIFYQRYPQWWPAADVYTRVCKRDALCEVTVYEHGSFNGWKVTFEEGRYNHKEIVAKGVTNNAISSLKVSPECKATLYEHDFTGIVATFTQGDYTYYDMKKKFPNDVATSMVVERS